MQMTILKKAPLRIAVDMDEVLADTLGEQLRRYNFRYNEQVTPDDLTGLELVDTVPPERRGWVLEMLHEPGFFANLELIPGAIAGMRQLCLEHEVFVASAAMEFPGSFDDKFLWLRRRFPEVSTRSIIFCGDKGVLDVDYLIDDTPEHFRRLRGVGLLFDAPHNRGHRGYPRVFGWGQVQDALSTYGSELRA
jgi:5'(3')-deoxyribonucleotidase